MTPEPLIEIFAQFRPKLGKGPWSLAGVPPLIGL